MRKLTLLLVEDNATIARQLCEFFEDIGWEVDHTMRGDHGVGLALESVYDVVILDLTLPDRDGLEVCREVKRRALVNLPILMLTARDAYEDKAQGFGEGADDYVTKPFEFRELALRCSALARRNHLHQEKTITVGGLVVDRSQRIAAREGQPLKLTKIGYDILVALAEAYPRAVTRTSLIHKVWADDPPDTDALRAHIYSLRKALDTPFSTPMLTTLINVGYKLELTDEV